jgi:hypothetical protein
VSHEARAQILEALALLSGFTAYEVSTALDVGRPDVLRSDPRCGAFFIGEAKDTETPGRTDTRERLSGYVAFLARAITAGLRGSVFAVCVTDGRVVDEWVALLGALCLDAALEPTIEIRRVPAGGVVLWVKPFGCRAARTYRSRETQLAAVAGKRARLLRERAGLDLEACSCSIALQAPTKRGRAS